MKKIYLIFILLVPICLRAHHPILLWYDKPALSWNSALPIGNGRIGAMVFGNPEHEEFQLNEETISRGSPYNNINENAKWMLSDIRKLIFEGKMHEEYEA